MPDDFDYAWVGEFIDDAPNWSGEDLTTARSMLADQQRAVTEAHPRDQRNREKLQSVVDALERAIETHGS